MRSLTDWGSGAWFINKVGLGMLGRPQTVGVGSLILGLLLYVAVPPAQAEPDAARAELRIRGHSIERLTLLEQAGFSQLRFDNPGETIRLPAGRYRVEEVELRDGYSMRSWVRPADEWFEVSPDGPNEVVVGAPLYPTATGGRYGSFLQLDYDLVDGAGRSYFQQSDGSTTVPPPPQFAVYKDGEQIGSGSFEYG